jgi:hypothetical protein
MAATKFQRKNAPTRTKKEVVDLTEWAPSKIQIKTRPSSNTWWTEMNGAGLKWYKPNFNQKNVESTLTKKNAPIVKHVVHWTEWDRPNSMV